MFLLLHKCLPVYIKQQFRRKSYAVVKAVPSDRDEILRLMQEVFFKSDPSSVYSKVSENLEISPSVQKMTLESLQANLSFVAKPKDNDKIAIGVAINGVRPAYVGPDYMRSYLEQVRTDNERILLELWRFLSMHPGKEERFFRGVKDVFEIRYLVVDPSYRKQGVATSLVDSSIKEASEKGFECVRVDATSHFTARIATAAGMDCLYELNYEDYRDGRGERVFRDVAEPHTKVRVFARKSEAKKEGKAGDGG